MPRLKRKAQKNVMPKNNKSRASELVDFLQDVALGKIEAGDPEVTAAAEELSKYLPDLDPE
jgi:hypothetical protein